MDTGTIPDYASRDIATDIHIENMLGCNPAIANE